MHKFVTSACAATCLSFASGAPLSAAPDNTLGAALMFAVVNSDGSLARGSGAISSIATPNVGVYTVTFDRNVTACGFTASVGDPAGGTATGVASVAARSGQADGILVQTHEFDGTAAAKSFYLIVLCTR